MLGPMSTKTDQLTSHARARSRTGAGRIEIAVLALVIALGVIIGTIVNSILLGFVAVIVLAGLARLYLAVTDSGGSRSGRHNEAHS